ncbi:hypothetical protein DKX38_015708 [Salix brachista]|uniref:Uncharacterized protein n=1 Tax=Salix brachista TaxID=2182728 RepID=A0A5N5L5Y6_9ROSI|nr:hypothetical protein DKX38_015708 [Salix brachista]
MRAMTLWPQMPLLVQVILNLHAGSTREAILTQVLSSMQLPHIYRKKNSQASEARIWNQGKGHSMLRNFVQEFQSSTVKLVSLPLPFSWKGELRLLEM